jgi:LysR family hydrogen peroxide-inducible transcriptional activator
MTLSQLEYIIALDNYRNFKDAADRCYITQPALSMQIRKLEDELGILLFDRTKHPVVPTFTGEKVINQARQVLQAARHIPDLIKEENSIVHGNFRVAIIPSIAPYLIPLFLSFFLDNYPLVKLNLQEITTEDIIQRLRQGVIDCGILATPLSETDLYEQPLYYEAMVGYVSDNSDLSKNKALEAKSLDAEKLWILNEGHCFRNQVLNLCKKKEGHPHDQFVYETGSLETLKRMVETGRGATILPELATKDMNDKQRLHLRYFKTPEPVREVSIVVHKSFQKKGLTDALTESIRLNLPERILKRKGVNITRL